MNSRAFRVTRDGWRGVGGMMAKVPPPLFGAATVLCVNSSTQLCFDLKRIRGFVCVCMTGVQVTHLC